MTMTAARRRCPHRPEWPQDEWGPAVSPSSSSSPRLGVASCLRQVLGAQGQNEGCAMARLWSSWGWAWREGAMGRRGHCSGYSTWGGCTSCPRGPGEAPGASLAQAEWRREQPGSSARLRLRGAAVSRCSQGACTRAGGCRHQVGQRRHVFPYSWCWGTSQHLVGLGEPPASSQEAGAGQWGCWYPRHECSWSLLQALDTPHAQGASGMGRAVPVGVRVLRPGRVGGLVRPCCRPQLWGGLPAKGQILAKRQGKQSRAFGARPGNLPAVGGWHMALGQRILLA